MYFIHLALEKSLKAQVCWRMKKYAPRIHSLPHLAEMAQVALAPEQVEFLAEFDLFNMAGRYPDDRVLPSPRPAEVRQLLATARKVYRCLRDKPLT